MQTETRTPCPNCRRHGKDQSGNNLSWFRTDNGVLTKKCVAGCDPDTYNDQRISLNDHNGQQNDHKPNVMVNTTTNMSGDLLHTGEFKELRGISRETCERYLYQVGELYGKAIHIANYLNDKGDIISQKIRFLDNKDFQWRQNNAQKQLFGLHTIPETTDTVYITEGEIDALTLGELGYPAISVSTGAGGQTRGEIEIHKEVLEARFKRIIFVFDNDKAGKNTVRDLLPTFSPGKAYNVQLGMFKDSNEYHLAGKDEELKEALDNPVLYLPKSIVTPSKDFLMSEDKPRIPLPYKKLQEMVRGISIDEGELWMLGAGAKSGKTTLCKQLTLDVLDAHPDFKVAVCLLEETLKKAGQSIITMDNNVPLFKFKENRDIISSEEVNTSYEKYIKNERIKFVDPGQITYNGTELLNIFKHLICDGYKFIILDHITMLTYSTTQKQNTVQVIDNLMMNLRQLILEYPATILLVCHLSRPDKGKGWDEGRVMCQADFRGSGAYEQLCDVMIGLERDVSPESTSKTKARLHVLANRITGEAGYADDMYYNIETGRYQTLGEMFNES